MKIQIEVDVSPEEARRFFGLPDITPIQDKVLERIEKQIEASADPAYIGKMAAQMVAGGVQSVDSMQKVFFDLLGGATRGDKGKDKKKKD